MNGGYEEWNGIGIRIVQRMYDTFIQGCNTVLVV